MKITFLGTSSMVPTKDRNVTSIHAEQSGVGMLFDCGEGTQRQMSIAGVSKHSVRYLFITHWHGDHVGGILGFLQTRSGLKEPKPLTIFGPRGTESYLEAVIQSSASTVEVPIEIVEVKSGVVLETEQYFVKAEKLRHGVPCVGYRVDQYDKQRVDMERAAQHGLEQGPIIGELLREGEVSIGNETVTAEEVTYTEHGNSFSVVLDTAPCEGIVTLSEDVDIMICESTFAEQHRDRATEYKHLTATMAAEHAVRAEPSRLILTHISQRYTDLSVLVEEAAAVFPHVEVATDFYEVLL